MNDVHTKLSAILTRLDFAQLTTGFPTSMEVVVVLIVHNLRRYASSPKRLRYLQGHFKKPVTLAICLWETAAADVEL